MTVVELARACAKHARTNDRKVPSASVFIALAFAAVSSQGSAAAADLSTLLARPGSQGGGESGVLEEVGLDTTHAVALIYDNESTGREHGKDTHVVVVVERKTRRPVLTLAELPPEAGYDTCRKLEQVGPTSVTVVTSRCDYGGASRVRLVFDLATGKVQREKTGTDVPISDEIL